MHARRFVSVGAFAMLVGVSLPGLTLCADDDLSSESYTVYVAQQGTHARCGPAADYYRTDPLRHGQALEVYAETDDGWLGVRPPDDSFCWVVADAITLNEGQEHGTVVEDRTVSWIGTHLGRARKYRWQVRLAKGEEVTVIGRSEREGPDGPQLWYRIVPPSGEFRWVHREQVVDSSEELVAMTSKQPPRGDTEFLPATPAQVDRGEMQSVLIQEDRPTSPQPVKRAVAVQDRSSQRRPRSQPSRASLPGPRTVAEPLRKASEPARVSEEVIGSGLNSAWQASGTDRRSIPPQRSSASTRVAPPRPHPIYDAPVRRPEPGPSHALPPNSSMVASAQASNPSTPAEPVTPPDAAPTARESAHSTPQASVQFLGEPRVLAIGQASAAPRADEAAGDSNWVAGSSRTESIAANQAGPPPPIRQVSGQTPIAPNLPGPSRASEGAAGTGGLVPTSPPMLAPPPAVSAERIARIEAESRGADVERLSLILSRLMAARASAAEAEPIAHAAEQLAKTTTDPVAAGRARLLVERVRQFQRVASRRPPTVAPASATQELGSAGRPAIPDLALRTNSVPAVLGLAASQPEVSQSGFLVQVYSARENSPPYALTDHSGRTLCYVTPVPGMNFRVHLNSHIKVVGQQGFLRGLHTPHLLASRATRIPE